MVEWVVMGTVGTATDKKSAPVEGTDLQSQLELSLFTETPPDHLGALFLIMAWLLEHQLESAQEFRSVALDPWLPDSQPLLESRRSCRSTGQSLPSSHRFDMSSGDFQSPFCLPDGD